MRFFWALTVGLLLGVGPGLAQPSLQARIDAAAPGDTLIVNGGVHAGPFSIDTPLVLSGTHRPHLRGNDSTHVVTINASGVTIQGMRITDSGKRLGEDHAGIMVKGNRATIRNNHPRDVLHGVYVKGADRAVVVENVIEGPPTVTRRVSPEEARRHDCSVPPGGGDCAVPLPVPQRGNGIHLWSSLHNTVTHNTVHHTRDGVYFSHSNHTYAARNTIHDVRYGLHYMYSDDNTFEHNRFFDNESGSALMYSTRIAVRHNVFRDNRSQRGYGLLLQTVSKSRFAHNRMIQNGTGVYLENSTRNTFADNVVASNYRGIRVTGSSMENRFGRNVIRGNLNTATVSGARATNAWHVDGRGNYWGPRGLLDLNADGVSELPHRTVDLFGERREDFPYVDLLAGSPGLSLLADALARVPGTGIPTITDEHPLVAPPSPPEEEGATGLGSLFTLGIVLLTVGAVALRRRVV
ncbi:NosD domain-containing protein [Salinibacter ruber]|uniref:NosD domain-containing protein n=1 Tax=Salinibacter ruber TaxID=146919 RepID=UPI002072D90C|nr:NosD domain-containing protein [Salinibacter ruber]